ncbi:MAG: DNA/RNA nuclease SfsA [Bacteriovorax sp.]|nr:DNA/RNA nuclease SfsA [Bacteriovorax sp.]
MKFPTPLISGVFLKRYKRFFADIKLSDIVITAHTANTGSMINCLGENWPALISFHNSPTRKLAYSFEMISNGKTWIGINTNLTNKLAQEAIINGTIKELQGYSDFKAEVKIGQSRIDILLSNGPLDQCFVEVKNVTLVNDQEQCLFPDSKTLRGQKHLRELMDLKDKGIRAVMLFIVQREDCSFFKIENTIDEVYCQLLKQALDFGVEILVYQCRLTPEEIIVHKKLQIV